METLRAIQGNIRNRSFNLRRLGASAIMTGALMASCGEGEGKSSDLFSPIFESETAKEEPKSYPFYKGVDLMKLTKDNQADPLPIAQKERIVELAKGLGVTHIAIDTPYDNPPGIDVIKDTREWVKAVREAQLSVSHRHMFTEFEGIYDQKKDANKDYIKEMEQWMRKNKDLIEDGDTWTPMPEPQNGGVIGINGNPQPIFKNVAEFNKFIRDAVVVSREVLEDLGKDVEVVCCGFDLFVVSGNNNPDWEGKSFLEPETVRTLGHIGVDHYPGPHYSTQKMRTYEEDLSQAEQVWPGVPIFLTETGKLNNSNIEGADSMFKTFKAHAEKGPLRGVSWWPFYPGPGDEGLLNPNLTPKPIYNQVQQGFDSLP